MKVVVLYTPAPLDAPPQDLDGLVQAEAVSAALTRLGHQVERIPFELDLAAAKRALLQAAPQVVFNLVEAVSGQDRLLHLAPALLEAMGLPFCGSGLVGMLSTTNKVLAKQRLRAEGLPTPDWWEAYGALQPLRPGDRVMVKSAWDHGSAGLDEHSLVDVTDPEVVVARLRELASRPGQVWFAERFVDGREFNLSVLGGPAGPRVLPPAEIRFEGYGPDKAKVVGYRAKWDTDSFEYQHTVRSFDFPAADAPLLAELQDLALSTWRLFGLRGWVRVDFRVDPQGRPWILETNANPCISPDAGFAAAAAQADLGYDQAIASILQDL
ncbi:MAG TPA: D-alanine--D-alanine ligase [Myxococcota bacterium]|nr:D-alanine--D-alanine ligase [Myxococcota bacterium]